MTEAPLLSARDLRVDVNGSVAVEHVTVEARGRSVALLGEGHGIIAALAGDGEIRGGVLLLDGWNVATREHLGDPRKMGLAPLDPPLPPRFTGLAYLAFGAELAGARSGEARALAERALGDLDLANLGRSTLDKLGVPERRALVLAQAIVCAPAVLVAAAPLAGLDGAGAVFVDRVLSAAIRGRRWLISVSQMQPGSVEHDLATRADDVLAFSSGQLVESGSLRNMEQGASGYVLGLRGDVNAFARELETRGVPLRGGPLRYFVDLPSPLTTSDLLALSVQSGAVIVEMHPRLHFAPPAVLQRDRSS